MTWSWPAVGTAPSLSTCWGLGGLLTEGWGAVPCPLGGRGIFPSVLVVLGVGGAGRRRVFLGEVEYVFLSPEGSDEGSGWVGELPTDGGDGRGWVGTLPLAGTEANGWVGDFPSEGGDGKG